MLTQVVHQNVKAVLPFVVCLMFVGCTEDNVKLNKKKDNQSNPEKQVKTTGSDVLSFDEVQTNMADIGAEEIPEPDDFTPTYEGYKDVVHYEGTGGEIYNVYVWNDPEDNGFDNAANNCSHKWYDNGDCKSSSNECEVVVDGGEVEIICCEDKAA